MRKDFLAHAISNGMTIFVQVETVTICGTIEKDKSKASYSIKK
jgi:hypothetical protein